MQAESCGFPVDTGGCNSFTHQSLLSADTDPFHLDSQFEFSRTYSHQHNTGGDRYLFSRASMMHAEATTASFGTLLASSMLTV